MPRPVSGRFLSMPIEIEALAREGLPITLQSPPRPFKAVLSHPDALALELKLT